MTTNALREIVRYAYIPFMILGLNGAAYYAVANGHSYLWLPALLGFVISVQLIVQHSNVDAALGPFRNHVSIGKIHHLHHVNWGKEGDVNFGLFSTLWDRLLGTFAPEPPDPRRRPGNRRSPGVPDRLQRPPRVSASLSPWHRNPVCAVTTTDSRFLLSLQ